MFYGDYVTDTLIIITGVGFFIKSAFFFWRRTSRDTEPITLDSTSTSGTGVGYLIRNLNLYLGFVVFQYYSGPIPVL